MRQFAITIVLLAVLCISPAFAQPPDVTALAEALKQRIDKAELHDGVTGIYVEDVSTQTPIFEYHAQTPLIPASCLKLLTTAAALYYLGPDFSYTTPLYYQGEIKDGVLKGSLIVKGSGDPTISGRFQQNQRDITRTFCDWADTLKNTWGIKKIAGNIIGDDDYFDDQHFGEAWYPGERGEWYCAEISALSFNDNCIDISWRGAQEPGLPAQYRLNPPTKYVHFISDVITVSSRNKYGVRYHREDKSNHIKATGEIGIDKQTYDWATIYNPTLYFVTILKETLEREGIGVTGEPLDIDDLTTKASYGQGLKKLTDYKSPAMRQIIAVVNLRSQNFYAEQLAKTLGKEINGQGSFAGGTQAIKDFLNTEKILEPGTVIVDGSGLSYLNRTSPLQLVKILRYMHKHPHGAIYFDSLPQAGGKGTLYDRFQRNDEEKKLAPRIWGKSGWLGRARSLSGKVVNETGKQLLYAIIVNDFGDKGKEADDLIDDLTVILASSTVQ